MTAYTEARPGWVGPGAPKKYGFHRMVLKKKFFGEIDGLLGVFRV
jgi:hypothetical protein